MSTTAQAKPDSPPKVDCTKDVRFATVMYGGVSLAIYINGVAQELFHMVRSTVTDANGTQAMLCDGPKPEPHELNNRLSGTNAIYLAKALANSQEIDQLKQLWINDGDIALLINDKKSVGVDHAFSLKLETSFFSLVHRIASGLGRY